MADFYTIATYTARGSIGYLIRRARNLMTARVEAEFDRHRDHVRAVGSFLMQLEDVLANHVGRGLARATCATTAAR